MKKRLLHEYIALVKRELEEDRLYDIADVDSRHHGIDNVVINIGIASGEPINDRLRIKISNVKNKFDWNNQFDLYMPTYEYDKTQVAEWITDNTITQIIDWVNSNSKLLAEYECGDIDITTEFLKKIISRN
jgi:hypothetical protein